MSEFLGRPVHLTSAAIIASGLLLGACSAETSHNVVAPETTKLDQQTMPPYGPAIDEQRTMESVGIQSPIISAEHLGVDHSADVDSTKYIEGKGENVSNKYMPLLRIELIDGTMHLKDSSPHGVEPSLLSWLDAQFSDQGSLIHKTLQSGALKSVVIGLMDDKDRDPKYSAQIGNMNGFFDENQRSAVLAFSHNMKTIDAVQFKESLDHEIVHSLLNVLDFSVFSTEAIDEQSQKDFMNVCHGLRDTALIQVGQQRQVIVDQLRILASSIHADPEWRESVLALADDLEKDGFMQFLPEQEKAILPPKIVANEKLPQCYTEDIFRMRLMAETQAGLIPGGDKGMDDALMSEIGGQFEDIQNNLYNLMRHTTIYSSLTDETYTGMKSWGHPFDGADELGASSMSILLNYPHELGTNVRKLSSEQQGVIVSTLQLFVDRIAEKYPELQGLFSDREAEFLDALHN